jgi:serine/threonine protein kinase/Tol biopolymer transport system component
MTPERWRRVEKLYHEAQARPVPGRADFLAEACREDEGLLREVESLLRESVSDDGLFEPPVPGMPTDRDQHRSLVGRSIGPYAIESLLGTGGMGEVYRAHDPKLGRAVAIKVLPRAFTSDPSRLARLDREARMLAAVNHPNICSIFGFEEADGVRFLVLEMVEGQTLAQVVADLSRQPSDEEGLRLPRILAISRQIAAALEAAHDKGIVHRDLKPANITVTTDGSVKVLDFGLAKAVAEGSSQPGLTLAPDGHGGGQRRGAVIGTAAYMSPEQARGLAVDKRTDIWSFGCVLYELLAGRIAFAGDTDADCIAAILHREPDWSALPATTPASVRRLLQRCLTKDARQRQRDIGDVRIELDGVDDLSPRMTAAAAGRPRSLSRRISWWPWAVAGALAAGLVWVFVVQRPGEPGATRDPFSNATFTNFTQWAGTEGAAEISADGRWVAFLADKDGEFDIHLSQVGTGRFQNLTTAIAPLGAPGTIHRAFGFNRDASEIWFSVSGDPAAAKMLLPLSGGSPRPFLPAGDATPSWSPTGAQLVFVRIGPDRLFLADHTGGDSRELPIAWPEHHRHDSDEPHHHNPVWSVDGQWIYFAHGHGSQPTDQMDVWRVRAAGGTPEQLSTHVALNFLAPLDERTVLYAGRAERRSEPWLWALDVPSRVARRVSYGLDQYTSTSASRDGRRIVATVARPVSSIWTVPLRSSTASAQDAEPYPIQPARAPRVRDGALFFLASDGMGEGLWRVSTGEPIQIRNSRDGALLEPPSVSAGGQEVAIVVSQEGKRRLVVTAADGTNGRTLGATIEIVGAPDWSPDGASVVSGGRDEAGPGLFRLPINGDAPVRLVTGPATNPICSPGNGLIVYAGLFAAGRVPLYAIRPDGKPVQMPPELLVRQGGYRFLPDGSGLVYLPSIPSPDFWLLDLATNRRRKLTALGNQGTLRTFDITADGQRIVFDRLQQNADVVLINRP